MVYGADDVAANNLLTVTLNEATVFPAKLYTHQHALTQKATLLEDLRSCSAATQDRTLA